MTASDTPQKTPEQWQDILKNSDFRAMFSTLIELEDLIGKENTTARQLAKVTLKDILLTARVMMVANSAIHPHASSKNENVVSEGALTNAIVRIGFGGLRKICITISLMDHVLEKFEKNQQLQQCIETSFDIAVHSRNVARKTNANEEDAFLVGLLQNLGELIFLCSSIPSSAAFKESLQTHSGNTEEAFKQLLGLDFGGMSKELASTWKLSESLSESFEKAVTPATQAAVLGRQISEAIDHGWESEEMNQILQAQLKTMGMNVMDAMRFIREGSQEAKVLSAGYSGKHPHTETPNPQATSQVKDNKSPRKKQPPTSLIRK